ncbi:MAG: hypothetical protein KF855_09975 [Acidobacteria bacterium]|nr:hypothetical protein [Acidobacteriota bacterium]
MSISKTFTFTVSIAAMIFMSCADTANAQTASADFRKVVEKRLLDKQQKLENICPVDTNIVARRVFKDYGAMFIAVDDVKYPSKCVFATEDEVLSFQSGVRSKTAVINNVSVTLQEESFNALEKARAEAIKAGLNITPRGGSASKRSFADTARIWNSRFEPGLKHWIAQKRISAADAEKARRMDIIDQVAQVMEWEKDRLWFSTRFNYSIFSSVAAPGTSQHLSMIALDVTQFADKRVRAILNKHGWFQTIIDDTPHFTYLGRKEKDLPKYGLRPETKDGFTFWIPNFDR